MSSSHFSRCPSPRTRRTDHVDRIHGMDIPDPYRWLEDVDSPAIDAWICSQNEHTQSLLRDIPFGAALRRRLEELSLFETIGIPVEAGGRLFYTCQGPHARQPSLVLTASGETRCLLDPETLSDDATVSIAGFSPSPSGRYVAFGLAEAGSDWQRWQVLDVDRGTLMRDELNWMKFPAPSWRKDESGFFYLGSDAPASSDIYKAPTPLRSLRFHRLGLDQAQDDTVLKRPDQPQWMFFGKVTADDRYLVITTQMGTFQENLVSVLDLQSPDGTMTDLIAEFESSYTYFGNRDRRFFFLTTRDAPFGRIVAMDLDRPEPSAWQVLVPESDGVIQHAAYIGGRFVVSALHDAESAAHVYDQDGTRLLDIDLPGHGTVSWVEGRDAGHNVYLAYSDVFRPTVILCHDLVTGRTSTFRETELPYDPDAFVTERHVYESTDGTRIPIFLSRLKATAVSPETPTCLYGYGGFNIPQSPSFRLDHLAWMAMGGQLAVACIRGGGEYGREWHQAGAREGRPRVFADFIAAAEWLIGMGRTSTSKLVIHGRSNGGLLVGACMTQRPDLYGACLPAVGVLDMLRFHKFTVGAFWASDYGSPDDAHMFPILRSYSPLHTIKDGTAYPPTLVTTSDHDDRVFPAHSFKFAAALQHAQGGDAPILLRIDERAGHGLGKPKNKLLDEIADNWIFAFAALGERPVLEARHADASA